MRRDEPPDQPDLEDLLPLVCDTCDFVARSVEDLDDHEHPQDHFRRQTREEAGAEPPDFEPSEPPEDVRDDIRPGPR